jgi:hypothetical protein
MSPRSRRRPTNAPRPELSREQPRRKAPAAPASPLVGTGIPEWQWRSTPVAFMFSLGGLVGLFVGAALGASNNYYAFLIFMAGFAMVFGLALGRVLRRWLAVRRVHRLRAG